MRLPTKHLFCKRRSSGKLGRITRTPTNVFSLNLLAGNAPCSLQHLRYSNALACSKVQRKALLFLCNIFKGKNVCAGQVRNMNVVADAGSVAGRIVVSKNAYLFPLSACNLHHNRQKVCRILFKAVKLTGRIVACRIKIAQSRKVQAPKLFVPAHEFLYLKLCKTVVVFRILWMLLVNRKILWLAKNRRAGRKDHVKAFVLYRAVQNIHRTGNIVNRIFFRLNHALARRLKSRKVNKSVKALCKSRVQFFLVKDRARKKFVPRVKILNQTA